MQVLGPSCVTSTAVCRICWETTCEANGLDDFLKPTPCACRDERSNVHLTCLERWITEARSQGRFQCGTVCHACGSAYVHPELEKSVYRESAKATAGDGSSNQEIDTREPVCIIGGTGYVGRSVALHLLHHPTFKLGAVVGSSATIGKPFSVVFEKKEAALVEHYGSDLWKPQNFPEEFMAVRVQSLAEVLLENKCKIALSFIAPEHGAVEDELGARGIKVFSISPHARFEFRNPLSVPEANPEVLRLAVANSFENPEWDSTSLVKSPNCVTCGVAIALRALDAKFGGVCDVSITTFQSLSGRGDAKYPKELVMGNVYPLKGTVERTGEYQKAELRRIMPSIGKISIAAYRVPVQKGHLVDIRVSFKKREPGVEKPTSQQIHDAFVEFDPLRDAPLPSKPTRLIRVKPLDVAVDDDRSADAIDRPPRLGTPRPKDDCEFENGMSIVVGNIDTTDDLFDVTFCVVVNNVARGAWGAALLNAEYWSFLRGRRFPKESEAAE